MIGQPIDVHLDHRDHADEDVKLVIDGRRVAVTDKRLGQESGTIERIKPLVKSIAISLLRPLSAPRQRFGPLPRNVMNDRKLIAAVARLDHERHRPRRYV